MKLSKEIVEPSQLSPRAQLENLTDYTTCVLPPNELDRLTAFYLVLVTIKRKNKEKNITPKEKK
jgi:hypothetical protein